MSASSIIQFYLNTGNTTATSSQNEITKSITRLDCSPDANTGSSLSTKKPDSFVIHNIENLPTAPTETLSNLSLNGQQSVKKNDNHSEAGTGSIAPSFFSIPLRFFSSRYSNSGTSPTNAIGEKSPSEGQKSSAITDNDSKNTSPIDVITESPVEIISGKRVIDDLCGTNTGPGSGSNLNNDQNTYSMERTNSELLKTDHDSPGKHTDLISGDYDPIYDTYISYINYTTAEGDLIL